MRKLQFHPCGNYKESYREELAIFETDFGRLWMLIGLVLLFGVIPFISSAIYSLHTEYHRDLCHCRNRAQSPHRLYGSDLTWTWGLLRRGCIRCSHTGHQGGFPFLGCRACGRSCYCRHWHGFWSAFGPSQTPLSLHCNSWQGNLLLNMCLYSGKALQAVQTESVVTEANLFGLDLGNDRTFYFVIFVCFAVMTWIAVNLVRTRYGRAFIAIRDNDRAAEGMGIPIFHYKLLSFA